MTRSRIDESSEDDGTETRGGAEREGAESDDDMPGDEEDSQAVETFTDAESFCKALRAKFKAGSAVDFHGAYPIAVDPMVSPRARIQMVSKEIWELSGYRFTVKDHRPLKSGHRTRYWCSQDEGRKKKSKASQNPAIRNRDNKDNEEELTITALAMIRDNVEWLTPAAMVTKVQAAFPTITTAQIRRAWVELSEPFWRFEDDQLLSTKKVLEEHTDHVDIFEPQNVPEGVEMICWGMKQISTLLKGKVVEIGVDATYNTNSKHLELYSLMGEQDGAGFPLSYLLLSTASSIDQGKRTQALTAWAKCVRDAYGIIAEFAHADKDMAEIGMLKVRTRLTNKKLSTTPYDPDCAHAEFSFIDVAFVPLGQADGGEYEGGNPDNVTPVVSPSQPPQTLTMANGLRITIPARQPLASTSPNAVPPLVAATEIELTVTARDPRAQQETRAIVPLNTITTPAPAVRAKHAATSTTTAGEKENAPVEAAGGVQTRFGRTSKPPKRTDAADPAEITRAIKARTTGPAAAPKATKVHKEVAEDEAASSSSEDEGAEGKKSSRRTFCPSIYREPILTMMEKHYCAHPLLPGYAHPSAEGIKRWAVSQMYKFCVKHGLREVWAYLWENWYRKSRWELWARSVHPKIPILKTTMILESHWRRIKHDFLHHFHMPRCDLLAWILIVKLAPSYYLKLARLLTDTGRYRELPCWRKAFKRVWRRLEKTPITLPVNPAYKTDAKKMGVAPVPPVFFLEVKRQRTAPFWVHPSLRPLSDDESGREASSDDVHLTRLDTAADASLDSEDEDDGDLVDTQPDDPRTFVEAMDENIDLIIEFAKGLKFQRQFRDQRMLQTLEREGTSFLRLARACLGKEKRLTSTRDKAPSTWDKSTGTAMFYRARPAGSHGEV
ncbi:hypothetical protein DFH08DRAFT_975430 [Mycena albidolilacea]|uniref:Uncharacterized protein n=1 Tax=Mycena albidolilacea TaxID=1033008 RepID=A0AAD7EAQ9_9AGAR|nr:hypothetical protein DFH08DRAFT_975430 [Mycena albidolilacea]